MKNLWKLGSVLLVGILLTACDHEDKEKEMDEDDQKMVEQALMAGQAQTINEIIRRATEAPCQPINLFNHSDEANKQEVNVINIECQDLNLPPLNTPEETQIPPAEVTP